MEIDKEHMRQVILDFPKQLEAGLELAKDITVEGKFRNVIVCGMGGSALPADLLATLFEPKLPFVIHKDYGLPYFVSPHSLVICVSYSGNTEETVSALSEAVEKKVPTVVIATGGKLKELATKHQLPFVEIPSGIQPRSAVGYMFAAVTKILANHQIMSDISADVKTTVKDLTSIQASLEKEGKVLAEKVKGRIPVVYASRQYQALAEIWKIRFNENAKIPAFYNYFPELNHNEMTGFSEVEKVEAKFYGIFLQDHTDHPRIAKRMDLTADVLKGKKIPVSMIGATKGSVTAKVFSSLLLSDWTSYHLALLNEVDPTPVPMIEDFKRKLI